MTVPPEPEILSAARLLAEGRPAAAAASLGALVGEAPTYAAAHVLRATALEAAGRIDEALVSWGRAAALVPGSALVHRERARLLATQIAPDHAPGLPPPVPDPTARSLHLGAVEPAPVAPAPVEPEAFEPAPVEPDPAEQPTEAPSATPDALEPGPVEGVTEAADPEPDAAEPAYLPHDDDEDVADGPLLDFGAPPPFDVGDLVADAPSLPESAAPPAPEPPAGAPPADPPAAPTDWGDETGLATVLPPESEAVAPLPADPHPFSRVWSVIDQPLAADEPPVDAQPVAPPPVGWSVVDESDVPAPPPPAASEPDVVTPEGDVTAPTPTPADPIEATAQDVPPTAPTVADELDSLIAQLEVAPRIKPDPAFAGPAVPLDAGGVDDLASETLAKIYAAQHQYVEAAVVYEKLAARQPEAADTLLERAAELRRKGG